MLSVCYSMWVPLAVDLPDISAGTKTVSSADSVHAPNC